MVGGVGIGVKLYPRVLFRFFFQLYGSFRICTAYPEKREFMLNAIKNVILVVVWYVVGLPRGSNLNSPFNPKIFFKGPSSLLFCLGVNRKRPLLLMIAP